MIPILYESAEKVDFTNNGLGRLAEAISCTVTEERNGSYELELEYPPSGMHFSDLDPGRIIACTSSPNSGLQLFEIYKVGVKIGDSQTFNARHISYRLSHIIIPTLKLTSKTPQQVWSEAVTKRFSGLSLTAYSNKSFSFSSDISDTKNLESSSPTSLKALIGGDEDSSILSIYGGELKWDNEKVSLLKSRGDDNNYSIRYGKNIVSLSQETNIEDTITGIIPYYKASVDDEDSEEEESVDKYWYATTSVVKSSYYDKYAYPRIEAVDVSEKVTDYGQRYRGDDPNNNASRYSAGKSIDIKDGPGSSITIPLTPVTGDIISRNGVLYVFNGSTFVTDIDSVTSQIESEDLEDFDAEELDDTSARIMPMLVEQAGKNYISTNKIGVPEVSIELDFVELRDTDEWENFKALDRIELCDMVTVAYEKLGISTKGEVTATTWNVLKDMYDSITVGEYKDTFIDFLSGTHTATNKNTSLISNIENAISQSGPNYVAISTSEIDDMFGGSSGSTG